MVVFGFRTACVAVLLGVPLAVWSSPVRAAAASALPSMAAWQQADIVPARAASMRAAAPRSQTNALRRVPRMRTPR